MNELIKQLLAVPESQLLRHEKVVAAYEGLCNDDRVVGYVMPELEVAAFEMRDACIEMDMDDSQPRVDWLGSLTDITDECDTYHILLSEPPHWIIAATLAWWKGQGS